MKLSYVLVVLALLRESHGHINLQVKHGVGSSGGHKIVKKQHVPAHMRKQYIDTYGGNAVMSDSSLMSNQGVSSDERQEAQENIANSGLTQNEVGGSQLQAMSNDLVESSESSAARQMIGNGLMQGGRLDLSQGMAPDLGSSIGGSVSGGLGAGLGGGSLEGGRIGEGQGGGETSLGLGGGSVEIGGTSQGMGALNDGLGSEGASDIGIGNGAGASLGGSVDLGEAAGLGEGAGQAGGASIGEGAGLLDTTGLGQGAGLAGGIGVGGSSAESIDGGSLANGGRLGDSDLGEGSFSDVGIDGGNLGGSILGNKGIAAGNLEGNIGSSDLNGLGEGLGDNSADVGGLGGGGNQISNSLGRLGTNGGSISDGIGLEALGSRIAAGSKAQNLDSLTGGGAHYVPGLPDLSADNAGLLGGIQSDTQSPSDLQLSAAADENPSILHTGGLASILPGKTVHAHVSDKPSNNRPAVSGPSMNAALQVQEEAKKQHQKRLEALKLKLKKLRGKLESLQRDGNKQNMITSSKQQDVNKEEINTLNELRLATQDAIKELHSDYPQANKKHQTDEPKHKSLGSKLKTVDFTAKETGDTLEELLQLLDPELHDKKRGQVDKMNTTRLDNAEETKLASLTKKAEDEVDILASQSRKNKTENFLKLTTKDKLKKLPSKTGEPNTSTKTKNTLTYRSLGCWRDDPERVVPSLENTSSRLKDGYRVRADPVKKCAQVAKEQGFAAFSVQNGGQCFGGLELLKKYKKYGRSRDCANDGRGGDYAMDVYQFQ